MVSQGPTAFSKVIISRAQRGPLYKSNRGPGYAEAERAVTAASAQKCQVRVRVRAKTLPLLSPRCTCVSLHPNAHPGHGVGVTFVHCRRNWATDTQGFIFSKGVTEVPQHGCPQALVAVLPPHKHGIKDRQQVACTSAVTTEAACRKARDMCCPPGCMLTPPDLRGPARDTGTAWEQN